MKTHPRTPCLPPSPTPTTVFVVLIAGAIFLTAARLSGLVDLPWAVVTLPLWVIPGIIGMTLCLGFLATVAVCALLHLVRRED